MKRAVRRILPERLARRLLASWRRATRPADAAALSGLEPVSAVWGLDRGTPIDRWYIERFLAAHAEDIHGRVLESGDPRYTRKFGESRVTRSDVLHFGPGNPEATIEGDLVTGEGLPKNAFDCIILVNTFCLIGDVAAAVATCRAALVPGGVLLGHFTGIGPLGPSDWGPACWSGSGDHMRFTRASAWRACAPSFPAADLDVQGHGNVRSVTAFLYGLAAEELDPAELSHRDPNIDFVIVVRALRRT